MDCIKDQINEIMKNLFDATVATEILNRIDKLSIDSEKKWGKMSVLQMLIHCSNAFKIATGELQIKRTFLGKFLGMFIDRSRYFDDRPYAKNIRLGKGTIVPEGSEFEKERDRLKFIINQYVEDGLEHCTSNHHPLFGHFSPEEWSKGMYKHLDHHLNQFGV